MLITTTPDVAGETIEEYLGIVAGETVLGVNMFKDLFAGVRDVVGGRSKSYEEELAKARTGAVRAMRRSAKALRAHAVVGVDIDYEVLGQTNGMLMVTACGTAVRFEGVADAQPEAASDEPDADAEDGEGSSSAPVPSSRRRPRRRR